MINLQKHYIQLKGNDLFYSTNTPYLNFFMLSSF